MEFDNRNWNIYTLPNGLNTRPVLCIAFDTYGNKWFGTSGNGVVKFDGTNWTTYNTSNGLAYNYVRTIATDLNGNLWIGTGKGVSKFEYINTVGDDDIKEFSDSGINLYPTIVTSNINISIPEIYSKTRISIFSNKWATHL